MKDMRQAAGNHRFPCDACGKERPARMMRRYADDAGKCTMRCAGCAPAGQAGNPLFTMKYAMQRAA